MTTMTYAAWVDTYRPIQNEFDDRGYDCTLFETFGEELDFVRAQPDPRCIWTLIDDGEYSTIASGWHLVNRLGYFITEVPFTGDGLLEIDVGGPEDFDQSDEDEDESDEPEEA